MVTGLDSGSLIPSRDRIWDAKSAKSGAVFHAIIAKLRFLSALDSRWSDWRSEPTFYESSFLAFMQALFGLNHPKLAVFTGEFHNGFVQVDDLHPPPYRSTASPST